MSTVDKGFDWFNTVPTMDFSDPTIDHNRVLVVEGEKFYIHSELISFHSEFFNSMFNGEFKEKNEQEIEIKDVAAEAFRNFLMMIYPVRMKVTKENYQMLIDVSVRFLAAGVFDKCRVFILDNIDTLDKIDLLEIAIAHNLKDIKEKLSSYIGPRQKEDMDHYFVCKKASNHEAFVHCPSCNEYNQWKVRYGFALRDVNFAVKNKDRISTLSAEAKSFILESMLKNF